ncbi:3'(2'),5'-bisphosphate nucleotidase CysQ [Kineococcus sp. NUM-3379]
MPEEAATYPPHVPDELDTTDDHAAAEFAATAAGRELLALRETAAGAPDLRRRGDALGQQVLAALLTRLRPGDAVLSEEAADDRARLRAERVWIVDPLDGTREYGEVSRDDWAVHVALWAGGGLVAGAVALPALGTTASTGRPPVVPPATPGRLRVVVSRSRPPAQAEVLRRELGAEIVPKGSAGAKAMAVVRGEADAYVHDGGMSEWDTAAPVAVALAAGLHASRLDGSPARFNQADVWMPDLLIARRETAAAILAVLRDAG